jgi:Protein of unknown function (DUF3105)
VASRKQQKEALRREREAREKAAKEAERRRRLIGYGAAGGLVAVALVVLVVLLVAGGGGGDSATAKILPAGGSVPDVKTTDLASAIKAAGCETKSYRSPSRNHITNQNEKVKYLSNPPAAGRHYQFPADDAAYAKAPPDTTVVHAQEHGRVVIWFKPSLPASTRADLKALYDKQKGYQLLLVPRSNMPYQVAETAWNAAPVPLGTGRVMGCKTISTSTWDALQDFIEDNRGNGPEAIP